MSLRSRLTLPLVAGVLALTSACSASSGTADEGSSATPETVVLTDDFDREVEVPVDPQRVAVIEWEGLVTKTLSILGVDDTVVAVDSATKDDPTRQVIVPAVEDATEVGNAFSGINYESLASLDPEVLFLEAFVASEDNRTMHEEAISTIEELGIPVVVFLSPSNFDEPDMSTAYSVIDMVGTVYDRSADTDAVVSQLKTGIDDVLSRIPEDGPAPSVAIFATVAYLMGEKSIQHRLFADLLGAENVAGGGTFEPISEEQLLAKDPDVLILIGHEGYLSTQQVADGENIGIDWAKAKDLRAIRESRMTALGYDEWRATVETPIALLKVAKTLYPDAFADVDVEERELAFYQDVFGLDEDGAREAVAGQQFSASLGS